MTGRSARPASIGLPKGAGVAFNVAINPSAVGAHSAILRLDDPTTVGIDYQSMNTVIVPHTFSSDNNFSVTETGTIDRAQTLHYFFEVPAGTPAFKVDLGGNRPRRWPDQIPALASMGPWHRVQRGC